MENGEICVEIQNLEHSFFKCRQVQSIQDCMKFVLETFLDRTVSLVDMIFFSFNHRNKKKLALALWFSVKMMFKIDHDKCRNKSQLESYNESENSVSPLRRLKISSKNVCPRFVGLKFVVKMRVRASSA